MSSGLTIRSLFCFSHTTTHTPPLIKFLTKCRQGNSDTLDPEASLTSICPLPASKSKTEIYEGFQTIQHESPQPHMISLLIKKHRNRLVITFLLFTLFYESLTYDANPAHPSTVRTLLNLHH